MIQPCRNCGKQGGQALHHDWDAVCSHCGQLLWLRSGDVVECRVAHLTPFGIIVELGKGVEGLVHITELADHAIRHPGNVVGVGSLIRAKVLRVDISKRRIGLSRKRVAPTTQ